MKKMMLLIAALCIAHAAATTDVSTPPQPAASSGTVPPLMPVRDGVEILNAITRPYVTNTVHADARRRADTAPTAAATTVAPSAAPSPATLKPPAQPPTAAAGQVKPQSASAAREEAARVAAAAEEARRVAAEQEAARKRAEERAEAMKKSLSSIAASLRLDSVSKQMTPKQREEQQQELDRAATAATATALGLDVDYAARMRKLRQAVRRCGGILTSIDIRVVEKLAGISTSDKERWERGEWERRDHAKLLGMRLMLRKLLMDRLSEVQLMRKLAEERMDKAFELMKPEWSANLAKVRTKYNISPQNGSNSEKESTRAGLLHPEKLRRKKDKKQKEMVGNLPAWIRKIRDTPRTPSARDNMRPIMADGLTDSAPAVISCNMGTATSTPTPGSVSAHAPVVARSTAATASARANTTSASGATAAAQPATSPTPAAPTPMATAIPSTGLATTSTTSPATVAPVASIIASTAVPHPYDQLSSYMRAPRRSYGYGRDDRHEYDEDEDDDDDWMVPF